jgi:hypothetical protein
MVQIGSCLETDDKHLRDQVFSRLQSGWRHPSKSCQQLGSPSMSEPDAHATSLTPRRQSLPPSKSVDHDIGKKQ